MRAHRPSQKMAQASAPYRPTPAAGPPSALESRCHFRPSLSSSHARDGPSGRGPARRCCARAGLAPRAARGGVRQGTVRARANERRGPAQRAGHGRQAHPAGHGVRASRRGTPPRSAAASGSAPAPADGALVASPARALTVAAAARADKEAPPSALPVSQPPAPPPHTPVLRAAARSPDPPQATHRPSRSAWVRAPRSAASAARTPGGRRSEAGPVRLRPARLPLPRLSIAPAEALCSTARPLRLPAAEPV